MGNFAIPVFNVAEQLAIQQFFRKSLAGYLFEAVLGTRRQLVYEPRHGLSASTVLSQDQNRNIELRYRFDLPPNFLHGSGRADKRWPEELFVSVRSFFPYGRGYMPQIAL